MSTPEAVALHDSLARQWRSDGPDAVFERIAHLSREQLTTLVMLHTGAAL